MPLEGSTSRWNAEWITNGEGENMKHQIYMNISICIRYTVDCWLSYFITSLSNKWKHCFEYTHEVFNVFYYLKLRNLTLTFLNCVDKTVHIGFSISSTLELVLRRLTHEDHWVQMDPSIIMEIQARLNNKPQNLKGISENMKNKTRNNSPTFKDTLTLLPSRLPWKTNETRYFFSWS